MVVKCPFEGCGKSFSCQAKLKDHENTHLKIKPFTCNVCSKRYSCKRYLDAHSKSHSSVFTCEHCGISFNRIHNLKRHRDLCLKEYKCDRCNKKYKKKGCFDSHIKCCSTRSSSKIYKISKQKFISKEPEGDGERKLLQLPDHKTKKIQDEEEIDKQDKIIDFYEDKKSDLNIKNKKAKDNDKCNVWCTYKEGDQSKIDFKSEILSDRQDNSKKAAICDICKAEYGEKRNLLLHMKAKHMNIKYECGICCTKFSHASSLRRHTKKFHG